MTSETCPPTPPRFWLRAVAAPTLAVILLTALSVWGGLETSRLRLDIAVGVLACALVPFFLRWPIVGGVAVSVLAALSAAATPAASVAVLYVAQRRRFSTAVTVGAVGLAAHLVLGVWRPTRGLSYSWWIVLTTAAYAALIGWGALAQSRRQLLDSLRERARRAEAEQSLRVAEARMYERTRIAREMHDVLAHRLSLVATYAGALEYRPDAPPEQLARAAGVVRAGVHQALDELREVIGVLRDPVDDEDDRPQPVLADVHRLVEESRDAGTTVALDNHAGDMIAVPTGIGRTAYRVIQEGLTNARKHAPGRSVHITMAGQPGERLVIDIRNESTSEPPPMRPPGTGTGLVGLTERVQLAGGHLAHSRAKSGEFHLHAWLPWPT